MHPCCWKYGVKKLEANGQPIPVVETRQLGKACQSAGKSRPGFQGRKHRAEASAGRSVVIMGFKDIHWPVGINAAQPPVGQRRAAHGMPMGYGAIPLSFGLNSLQGEGASLRTGQHVLKGIIAAAIMVEYKVLLLHDSEPLPNCSCIPTPSIAQRQRQQFSRFSPPKALYSLSS